MSKLQKHNLSCDILVVGGGPSGVPCALASARHGSKVILIQNRSVLGGNCSSEIRMHIVGADGNGWWHKGEELAVEARESGIIEEIRLDTSVNNPQRSASILDLTFYDKCRMEENLDLYLDTTVTEVEMEDGRIVRAIAERQSTDDVFYIKAKLFIDCTGDGKVGYEAGANFQFGREGKEAYGESMAIDKADGKTLGSSILFTARKHDHPMPFIAPSWVRKFSEHELRFRPHAEQGIDKGLEYGYWWAEWGGQLNTIKDNEIIREELLAIVLGIWDHVKNHGDHGADNWALDWFGFLPGKRESRRFEGLYTLTQEDLIQSKSFPDSIAYGGWPIDTHPPEGVDKPDEKPSNVHVLPYLYEIPLRCFISNNIPNLMFAGRSMSASHIAFASTRVMATCAVAGQGVGTAAAYAIKNNLDLQEIAKRKKDIKNIQQHLLRDDCYLIGVKNEDKNDKALTSTISASSEYKDGKAENIVSGQTRSAHGEGGVPKDRSNPGVHRWMSDPKEGMPAWIKLEWEKPIDVKEIQVIFDTALHRNLTLSHSAGYSSTMVWGKPQPETVKDYEIEYFRNDKWHKLLKIENNWQRMNRHKLEKEIQASAIRITVKDSNGIDHARICEVRVY